MKWHKVLGYQAEVTKDGKHVRNTYDSIHWKKKHRKICTVKGYKKVSVLNDNFESKMVFVHVLVALTFIRPKPTKEHQVNHKDLDKSNNHYKNLEWLTSKKNVHHARKGLGNWSKGYEENGMAKLTNYEVISIRWLYSTGYFTMKEIANEYNVSRGAIEYVINIGWK